MITKTYLDGKLNQLEERLKRRIDMKDERTLCEIEVEVRNLKEHIKLLEEKIEEDRDIIKNYIEKQDSAKQKTEKAKLSKNKEDVITSDF